MKTILLDTNYLIKTLVRSSEEGDQVRQWITEEFELITSAICWYEFLCGPVDAKGVEIMEMLVQGRIIPFTGDQAREAARLFNKTGRKRSLRVDSMIAAAAIINNAALATDNSRDFSAFTTQGLVLL
ncbi:MAG TPA: PIN domain-containing protein [Sediminispirochaeta sp.]|nr:PIN domain-containing protein [Sediminispirochaeta sp.]